MVLASSAKADEVDHYLDLLDARELADGWTTSADVEATKPEPDLVVAAIEKAGGGDAVMVGDSAWDCEAAKRAGITDDRGPHRRLLGDRSWRTPAPRCVFESIARAARAHRRDAARGPLRNEMGARPRPLGRAPGPSSRREASDPVGVALEAEAVDPHVVALA